VWFLPLGAVLGVGQRSMIANFLAVRLPGRWYLALCLVPIVALALPESIKSLCGAQEWSPSRSILNKIRPDSISTKMLYVIDEVRGPRQSLGDIPDGLAVQRVLALPSSWPMVVYLFINWIPILLRQGGCHFSPRSWHDHLQLRDIRQHLLTQLITAALAADRDFIVLTVGALAVFSPSASLERSFWPIMITSS